MRPVSDGDLTRLVLTGSVAVVAVLVELRTRRIPNGLTLGGLVSGLVAAVYFGRTGDALMGVAVAAVPSLILFRREAIGGGGVKLVVALAACAGLVASGVAVGLGALAVLWLWLRHRGDEGWEMASSPLVSVGFGVGLVVSLYVG